MSRIIEVKNLGKKYNIAERQGYIALRDVLSNIIKSPAKWFGVKVKTALGQSDHNEFWALKNINFELRKGEVLGIIGKNGAGKSTLLKILSQITPPTTGEIRLKGRVGSLLEVGTGFHPELTGRENIFLNGAILGMRKKEIEQKFDEIVEFSGVEKFLDMPVKRYSSGMYVRLAFAVAAHLEPEILIVDEVLAVGDVEFQKKCLGKMEDITKKEGRTVLFVSHNMGAIRNLCNRCILLDDGKIIKDGPTNEVISEYMAINTTTSNVVVNKKQHIKGDLSVEIKRISVKGFDNNSSTSFLIGEEIFFSIDYEVQKADRGTSFWIIFYDTEGKALISSFQKDVGIINPDCGKHRININFPNLGLLPGKYLVSVGVFYHDKIDHYDFADWVEHCMTIEVMNAFFNGGNFDHRLGIVNSIAEWKNIS